MEHRCDVVEAEQSGLSWRGFGKVGNVVNDGFRFEQLGLNCQNIHPGSPVLVVSFKVVAVKESQMRTILIKHFENTHVGLVYGKIMTFFKGDPVKFVSGVEDAVLEDA